MSTSNVRSIESLAAFRSGMVKLSDNWDKTLQDLRVTIQRVEQYFSHDRPRYWKRQVQLAERELTEAKDNLSQKRAVARASDRVSATEAVQRVNKAKRRLTECREKQRKAKAVSLEMSQQCDALRGPLADVAEHCEVGLPKAALQLQQLVDHLRAYAEQADSGLSDNP